MPAKFTACYIIEDASERHMMTADAMAEFVKENAAEYTFVVWHIQDDAPPRDVTEDMLDLYQVDESETDDDGVTLAQHHEQERLGWGNV